MTRRTRLSPLGLGLALGLLSIVMFHAPLRSTERTPQQTIGGSGDPSAVGPATSPEMFPQGVQVERGYSTNMAAGEVQSTVVPPGTKWECPEGRLIISNDQEKNPGGIRGLDLDNLGGTGTWAVIEPLPGAGFRNPSFDIASNDHDVITLANGDILYARLTRVKTQLDPEPAWFDHAFKLAANFGPGARSGIRVEVDGLRRDFLLALRYRHRADRP